MVWLKSHSFAFGQNVFRALKSRKQRPENWVIRRREKVPVGLNVIQPLLSGIFCHVDKPYSVQIISSLIALVNNNLAQVVQK
jgi:hypothetical protein